MNKLKLICSFLLICFLQIQCQEAKENNAKTSPLLLLAQSTGDLAVSSVDPVVSQANAENFRRSIDDAFKAENDGSFTFNDNITITAADGVKISANLFVPKTNLAKYPTVIFVNSWALNEYEYLVPAAKLAKKGYIVLSISTRGFGTSGGLISVAGHKDIEDLSSVIDYLQANTAVDSANIGIAGISYGAGISLIGLSKDPRIKTAVAMSGWGSLTESLYGNKTPRLVWGLILITAGYFTGHMDPIIVENFKKLLANRDVAQVIAWADESSPLTYINALNAANKPVYISNNLGDNLFQPNQMLDYYEKLTVPKKLDLNNGIHATAEIGGLIGAQNYVWDNAYLWFDYWLKGVNNGILSKPQVTIQKRFSDERISYASWPIPKKTEKSFFLKPMSFFSLGKMASSVNTSWDTNSIFSWATIATTGVPLIADLADIYLNIPVWANIGSINRTNAVVYQSDYLNSPLKIRGKTFYKGRISSSSNAAHVTVYLYDVDVWGNGKLITHGTATLLGIGSGDYDLNVDLQAVAYEIPTWNRIAIAIDNVDPLYSPPPGGAYTTRFKHSSTNQSTLRFESE